MTQTADYFARNQGAITSEQQQTLQRSTVAVIGCGGLGGYVIEQLVRIGVGRLHLFDPDTFSPSNCNRQLNALASTMGRNKAVVAAERSTDIYPFGKVVPYPTDFRQVDAADAFAVDVAIDCLDDIKVRRDLAALCTEKAIPLVHGAVNGWCGQVGVQLPGGDLFAKLYPNRPGNNLHQPLTSVLSFTVAVIASLQTAETVHLLLNQPSPLHNSWMHVDLKDGEFFVAD